MRTIAIGLLVLIGTGAAVCWGVLASADGEARKLHQLERERLVPLTQEDSEWFGTFIWSARVPNEITLRPDGTYHELYYTALPCNQSSGDDCGPCDLREREGRWSRDRSALLLEPEDLMASRRLDIGRIDGEPVLMDDFSTWHRGPGERQRFVPMEFSEAELIGNYQGLEIREGGRFSEPIASSVDDSFSNPDLLGLTETRGSWSQRDLARPRSGRRQTGSKAANRSDRREARPARRGTNPAPRTVNPPRPRRGASCVPQ